MKKNIDFKRKKRFSKAATAILCALLSASLAAGCFLAAKKSLDGALKPGASKKTASFKTGGFEDVYDLKCLNETAAVFTDVESGARGLMTLDGKITEKAEHKRFFVIFDARRSPRLVVESPRSEYLLLVDAETLTVSKRQYNGPLVPSKVLRWNEKIKRTAWYDEKGFAGVVEENELSLARGLYPLKNSPEGGSKYGYINEELRLVVPAVYDEARDFSEGLAAVKKNGEWGYINADGTVAVPFEFDSCASADASGEDIAFSFRRGLAPARKNGKFGIINVRGETAVDFEYDRILQGADGVYLAVKNGKTGILKVREKYLAAPCSKAETKPTSERAGLKNGTYVVKTKGSPLNLRANPDVKSPVLDKIPNGSEIEVSDSVSGWAYCRYGSFRGWVSSNFLEELEGVGTAADSDN